MGEFYIHIADPGFPDPPYPGERRLGPYQNKEEALAQAVSDGAIGMGVAVGVYEAAESANRADDTTEGKSTYSHDELRIQSEVLYKELKSEVVADMEEDKAMVERTLPEGITWADLKGMTQ